MGSRATFTVGGFGGFEGRGLKKGDRVRLKPAGPPAGQVGRRLRTDRRPQHETHWEIEAMRGPQADPDYMTPEDMEFFFSHPWKVDRNSNRMGVRLESHKWRWARASGGVAGGHPSNILDNGYAGWTLGNDAELMPFLSSANIACGYHGGDPHVMRNTVRLARKHGVAIVAHDSFPDLIGFGRRRMDISPQELKDYV